jgi:hypothetical protein
VFRGRTIVPDAAVIEYKAGGYTIQPGPNQSFTFWWGDGAEQSEYFNVSIAPDPKIANLVPLIEEKREIALYEGTPPQTMLILTLTNNNPGPVEFVANHVRVHVVSA